LESIDLFSCLKHITCKELRVTQVNYGNVRVQIEMVSLV